MRLSTNCWQAATWRLLYSYWHDRAGGKGRCRIYRRTNLFEEQFNFRLPPRLIVTASTLLRTNEERPIAYNRKKVNSITALSTYANLVERVKLTLSDRRAGLQRGRALQGRRKAALCFWPL